MKNLYTMIVSVVAGVASLTAASPTGFISDPSAAGFTASEPASKEITLAVKKTAAAGELRLSSELMPNAADVASSARRAPAKAPAADTWKEIGTGEYMEDFYTILGGVIAPYTKWEVPIEQSQENPGWYRLQPYMSGPLSNMFYMKDPTYLYVNATDPEKVYFEDFLTFGTYPVCNLVAESEAAKDLIPSGDYGQQYMYGTLKDNVISFPPKSAVFGMNDTYWLTSPYSGCQISLPGGAVTDYAFEIINEVCVFDKVTLNFTKGVDVASAKYVILHGVYYMTDANANAVLSMGTDVYSSSATFTPSEPGHYSILGVATNSAGEIVGAVERYFILDGNKDEDWAAAGTATFNEIFLHYTYKDFDDIDMTVDVQESKSKPGYYRIPNPYATHPKVLEVNGLLDHGHNHYLYIDATDPTHVMVEESILGMNLGYGDMTVESFAYPYVRYGNLSIDIIEQAGIPFGTMEDGLIIFPENSLSLHEIDYNAGMDQAIETEWLLDFSELSGIDCAVKAETNVGEVEYFNLQGMKVVNPENGVYIRRQGGEAKKVLIK